MLPGSGDSPSASPAPSDRVAAYAAAQSVAELSLGSAVHALHLPMGGHLLSLNQVLILVFACKGAGNRKEGVRIASGVANAAAVLKSLSPAGKRLSPMLAISAQGGLFAIGMGLGGASLWGAATGAVLLSFWAFAHPLLTAYVIFGAGLFEAIGKLWRELSTALGIPSEAGAWFLLGVVALKAALAASLSVAAWLASDEWERRYLGSLERIRWSRVAPSREASAWRAVLGDLLNPLFVAGFALSVAFFALGQHATAARATLYALRILSVALIGSWLVRRVGPERALRRFPRLAATVTQALRQRSRS